MNKTIAIIPARGGSKRIPRKNIKDFFGKPLIAYSIEVALKSKLFDKVIVSTDDEEIAKIALEYGAVVPFIRPKELSDDFTGTGAVVNHALEYLKEQGEVLLLRFANDLEDCAKVDQLPQLEGKTVIIMFSPKKTK